MYAKQDKYTVQGIRRGTNRRDSSSNRWWHVVLGLDVRRAQYGLVNTWSNARGVGQRFPLMERSSNSIQTYWRGGGGLKFKPKNEEMLPGEKKVPGKITVKVANTAQADTAIHGTVTASADVQLIDYKRFSDVNKLIWVVARVLSIAKNKSFKHGNTLSISRNS